MKCQIPSLLFSVRQPSVHMHECIHQSGGTSLAFFLSSISLPFFLLAEPRCEWDWTDLSLLCCLSVNCSDNQMNSGNAKNAHTQWLNMLLACNYVPYHICRAYCTEYNTESANTYVINESPRKYWPIIDLCESQGEKKRKINIHGINYKRITIIAVIKTKPGAIGTLTWHFSISLTPA